MNSHRDPTHFCTLETPCLFIIKVLINLLSIHLIAVCSQAFILSGVELFSLKQEKSSMERSLLFFHKCSKIWSCSQHLMCHKIICIFLKTLPNLYVTRDRWTYSWDSPLQCLMPHMIYNVIKINKWMQLFFTLLKVFLQNWICYHNHADNPHFLTRFTMNCSYWHPLGSDTCMNREWELKSRHF